MNILDIKISYTGADYLFPPPKNTLHSTSIKHKAVKQAKDRYPKQGQLFFVGQKLECMRNPTTFCLAYDFFHTV